MPPKAKPPPEEPPPPEEEKPLYTPEEMLARKMGMNPKPADPKVEILLERSASIQFDPKMKEMRGMLEIHNPDLAKASARSGGAASSSSAASPASPAPPPAGGARTRLSETLRTGGCGLVDRRMKELEHAPSPSLVRARPGLRELESSFGSPPRSPVPQEGRPNWRSADEENALKDVAKARLDRFDTAFAPCRYRDTTDNTLKRLLIDMDLARDDRQRHYSHQTRCNHLDATHKWYQHHTLKDDRKERLAPPYLSFSREGPVSPGSLRVQHMEPSPLLLSKCSSAPSLRQG